MTNMRRRTVLAALVAGVPPLTGCGGRGGPETATPTPAPVPTVTEVDPGTASPTATPRGGPREVAVTAVDDVPADSPLDLSVEVVESTVDPTGTARLRVTATNTADYHVWRPSTRTFDVHTSRAGPRDQRLLFVHPGKDLPRVRPDCWRAARDSVEDQLAVNLRYAAGETRRSAFDLYGHVHNTGPCMAPGDYPTAAKYLVTDDADTPGFEWEFDWGFTVTIEEG